MPPVTLPAKMFRFKEEARDEMFEGVDLMREAVTATLGPNGRNVAIDRYMIVDLTKDGVTALGDVVAEEPFAEMGCKMIREASTKTNDDAGDGTTSAVELTHAMIKEGMKKIKQGTNVIKLQSGMQKAIDECVSLIKSMSNETKEDVAIYEQVATISAQDAEIGKKVAEVFMESGENGVIDIERMDKPGIETEHTDGMQLASGWIRPQFINDFTNYSFVAENVAVVVTDREVTVNQELQFLEMLGKKGIKRVVLICDECSGEALGTFLRSAQAGAFKCCVVKVPAYGTRKMEILKDIAAMTGATVISDENGLNLDEIQFEHIGMARQITVRQKKTTIVAKRDHEIINPANGEMKTVDQSIKDRVEQLKGEIEQMVDGYEQDKVKERLASLTDGVSVVRLGAATEIERILNKRRTDDAIRAVQCAREEGVVAGGGTVLLKCVRRLSMLECDHPDEQEGIDIVLRAIQAPALRILEVAGIEPEPAPWYFRITPCLRLLWTKRSQKRIVDFIIDAGNYGIGYDLAKNEFANMFEIGVLDPAKVVRVSLQNAASCAKGFLSTEVAITPVPAKDPTLNRS